MIPQYLGTCRVQLILERDTVRWGETVTGSVVMLGGTRDQRVLRVEAYLAAATLADQAPSLLPGTEPIDNAHQKLPLRASAPPGGEQSQLPVVSDRPQPEERPTPRPSCDPEAITGD